MTQIAYYHQPRGTWEDPIFQDSSFTEREAWLWLREHACFKDSKIRFKSQLLAIKRGQIAISFRRLKTIWHWGQKRIQHFLRILQEAGRIGTDTGTGMMIITIHDYELFKQGVSDSKPTNTKKNLSKKTALGTSPATQMGVQARTKRKTEKEEKKEKKKNNPPDTPPTVVHEDEAHNDDASLITASNLLKDSCIPKAWQEDCEEEMGWHTHIAKDVFADFKCYWLHKKRQSQSRSLEDWRSAWRNWYRGQRCSQKLATCFPAYAKNAWDDEAAASGEDGGYDDWRF